MKQIEEGNFWFVRMDGRIVGYVGLEFIDEKTVLLKHLAVQRKYRKRRIGSTLFDHAVRFARSKGATTAAFVTMYYHFNRFKRRGFRTCPRKFLPENVRSYWMFTAKRYMKCAAMIQEFPPQAG